MTSKPEQRGYCWCGCGGLTPIATQTRTAEGIRKGEPVKYIVGHATKQPGPDYIDDPETGCRIWQKAKDENGYGTRWSPRDGKVRRAHVIAWEDRYGPVPEGMELDHTCRNRACINTDHLEPVTHAENMRRSSLAKLTWDDVREIRRIGRSVSQRTLARRFGVTHILIGKIIRHEVWKEETHEQRQAV